LIAHLAKRFVISLRPGGPSSSDEAWVLQVLSSDERTLFARMGGPDRRHHVAVARRVQTTLGIAATDEVLAAALLHDVGKIDAGLGTLARVLATVVAAVVGRDRAAQGRGRLGRYVRHPELGAAMLAQAGSAALAVTWAGEHHLPEHRWTLPVQLASALKAADDG